MLSQHSVQNVLSSSWIPKNVKIKIHRAIMFSVVLYECETWFETLRERHRPRVFENSLLRKIFGLRRDTIRRRAKKT